MPTSSVMTSLEMTPRSAAVDGWSFQMGSRSAWEVAVRLASIPAGLTLSLAVQSAPRDEDAEFVTRKTLGPYTNADSGTTVKAATDAAAPDDLTLPPEDAYVRIITTSLVGSGTYHLEAVLLAPFLDPSNGAHIADFAKDLRTYSDGLARIVERAEALVLDLMLGREWNGRIQADLDRPDALTRIQAAIRAQAELEFRRERLSQSRDPSAAVTLRELPELSHQAHERLEPLLPARATEPWRGR